MYLMLTGVHARELGIGKEAEKEQLEFIQEDI
jgi:hypothetical protein